MKRKKNDVSKSLQTQVLLQPLRNSNDFFLIIFLFLRTTFQNSWLKFIIYIQIMIIKEIQCKVTRWKIMLNLWLLQPSI